jgi:hypothetical protein
MAQRGHCSQRTTCLRRTEVTPVSTKSELQSHLPMAEAAMEATRNTKAIRHRAPLAKAPKQVQLLLRTEPQETTRPAHWHRPQHVRRIWRAPQPLAVLVIQDVYPVRPRPLAQAMRTPTPGPTTSRDPLLESWATSSEVQAALVKAKILSTQAVCFTPKEKKSPMI